MREVLDQFPWPVDWPSLDLCSLYGRASRWRPASHRPATDEVLGRHPRVVEEDLVEVEVVLIAGGRERPRTTPARSVGIISALMRPCLGASGSVRTKVNSTSRRARGRPHLLSVHHEVVAVHAGFEHCPGSQRRQVGTGSGLRSSSDAVISARRIGTAHFCCCLRVRTRSATRR